MTGIGAAQLIPDSSTRFFWYADILNSAGCSYLNGVGDKVSTFTTELRDLFLKAAGRLPNDASRAVVDAVAHDTEVYLGNQRIGCAVDKALEKIIFDSSQSTDSFIVVAHSMGSLVAYKTFLNNLGALPVHVYFLTFGSMLAELDVQRALLGSLLTPPPVVPMPVEWWRNVVNRGDLLAFPSAGVFFTENPAKAPKDLPINTPQTSANGTAYFVSRHDAGAYLRDPSTANAIREAWCAVASESPDCKQSRVAH